MYCSVVVYNGIHHPNKDVRVFLKSYVLLFEFIAKCFQVAASDWPFFIWSGRGTIG
ncbi:MAG TPA: hypothetical protein DEB17_05840 [Chlorobaculum sp.]|uniref:Uncharacterized protein n=1 Tax=Chlorobaculum tepidum (strain ATCC 49652 / DSM 12025 / NBRC 103806 / TLS) TaxID=194439 RepID=Q8KF42_CHLTE|nr:hypothetical protein CT0490 [Chlorobaculum tepidum TLS]HBU23507.1 hypothetical protein [Chlorobaculum sp.]